MSIFFIPGFNKCPIPYCQLSSQELCSELLRLHRNLGLSRPNDLKEHCLESFSPVPESIIYLNSKSPMDSVLTTFMVGFRNGMVGEYSVHDREEKNSTKCLSLVEIGTRPVTFARVDGDSLLCISNRIVIARRRKSNGRIMMTPVLLSANITSATVLLADETIWASIRAGSFRAHSGVSTDCKQWNGDCIPVMAYVDDLGRFFLTALREQVNQFDLNAEPQHILKAPGKQSQFLTTCWNTQESALRGEDVCDIRLIDMEAGEEKARLSISPGSRITSMCLWPSSEFIQQLQLIRATHSHGANVDIGPSHPVSASRIAQGGPSHGGEVSRASKVLKKSTTGIHFCLSTARGMAAALMCFRFIGRQPASCSSPNSLDVCHSSISCAAEKPDGFLVTAGTRSVEHAGLHKTHRVVERPFCLLVRVAKF